MSAPTTFEFAKIAVRGLDEDPGDEVVICGVQTTGFNSVAQTNDRFVNDCAAPFRPAERRLRVTGRSRTLTGSGLYNTAQTTLINSLLGVRKTYLFTLWQNDGTEAGDAVGTWEGPGIATAVNIGASETDLGSIEITVESDGAWTYTAAA
jgi:hypothetical protein